MTQPAPAATSVWTLIAVIGVLTFALRLSFIQLSDRVDAFPPQVVAALKFVPVAVLSALILPALVSVDGPVVSGLVNARSVAGAVATVVAWRTRSMTATIAVGMGVLWSVQFLVG
ncbi:AzlD domain-containing protein [Haloarchaeobius sp. HRN-SO-5]|uniref:AzlD domain-containing protein n=1 Tax=Haloarchaeobius sp. HRN-SO-5 TaxID=3446118 RepID=UPI003EB8013B